MALGEIYIKLVVSFPNDPKVRALARFGPDAGLARDLYVQMCLYCKDMLSDGLVPFEQVGLLVYPLDAEHGNQLAKQLASVGLTKEEANAWRVLAFTRRNGTREDTERLSEVRAKAGQAGGRKSRKRPAQKPSQANRKQVGYQDAQQTGSNAVSVSVPVPAKNAGTGTEPIDIQTPAASAANGLTITQRSKRITDAYAEAEPMCKWPAVNGVVVLAIKSGKYADDEILAALLRMAKENRSVTVDGLRTEIGGLPPSRGVHHRPDTDQLFEEAAARIAARKEITP